MDIQYQGNEKESKVDIKITPEMIFAGVRAVGEFDLKDFDPSHLVARIYFVMAAEASE